MIPVAQSFVVMIAAVYLLYIRPPISAQGCGLEAQFFPTLAHPGNGVACGAVLRARFFVAARACASEAGFSVSRGDTGFAGFRFLLGARTGVRSGFFLWSYPRMACVRAPALSSFSSAKVRL